MKKTQRQKALEHNCDGKCYWGTGMCPRVEYCEETRKGEFRASILATLILFGLPISVIVGIVIFFLR